MRKIFLSFISGLLVLPCSVNSMCYSVYDFDNTLLLRSARSPVQLSGSISESVQRKYPGGSMTILNTPCSYYERSAAEAAKRAALTEKVHYKDVPTIPYEEGQRLARERVPSAIPAVRRTVDSFIRYGSGQPAMPYPYAKRDEFQSALDGRMVSSAQMELQMRQKITQRQLHEAQFRVQMQPQQHEGQLSAIQQAESLTIVTEDSRDSLSGSIFPNRQGGMIHGGPLSGSIIPRDKGGMIHGGPLSGTFWPGSEGGMIHGGPLSGSIIPGSEGGMIHGGAFSGTILPPR